MVNAATIPRAPVIAFQPAIAAARDSIVVWSLTAAAIPTSIDALAAPGADRRDPQDPDVGRERVGDEREQPERAADPHRDQRPEPVRDAPRRSRKKTVVAPAVMIPMMPTSARATGSAGRR